MFVIFFLEEKISLVVEGYSESDINSNIKKAFSSEIILPRGSFDVNWGFVSINPLSENDQYFESAHKRVVIIVKYKFPLEIKNKNIKVSDIMKLRSKHRPNAKIKSFKVVNKSVFDNLNRKGGFNEL